MLGCDYCESIKGIGPQRAMQLIKQHGSIEKILENIDTTKYAIPEDWPFQQARQLFHTPEVFAAGSSDLGEIKWEDPQEDALVEFLVKEKGFR